MLLRQTLRYVLADDPGAGKTMMAGLLICELLIRADTKHVLIMALDSLADQWQDKIFEKLGLLFTFFFPKKDETVAWCNSSRATFS